VAATPTPPPAAATLLIDAAITPIYVDTLYMSAIDADSLRLMRRYAAFHMLRHLRRVFFSSAFLLTCLRRRL